MSVKKVEKSLGEIKIEFSRQLKKQSEQFNEQIEKIMELHINPVSKEPRLISYRAHDKMQLQCKTLLESKIANQGSHFASELTHIKDTCDEIKDMALRSTGLKN